MCSSCEKHREKIAHAVTEEEKADSLAAFTAHLQLAQAERRFYQDASRKANEDLIVHQPVSAPPYLPLLNHFNQFATLLIFRTK